MKDRYLYLAFSLLGFSALSMIYTPDEYTIIQVPFGILLLGVSFSGLVRLLWLGSFNRKDKFRYACLVSLEAILGLVALVAVGYGIDVFSALMAIWIGVNGLFMFLRNQTKDKWQARAGLSWLVLSPLVYPIVWEPSGLSFCIQSTHCVLMFLSLHMFLLYHRRKRIETIHPSKGSPQSGAAFYFS